MSRARSSGRRSHLYTLRIEAENRFEEIDRVNQGFESFAVGHELPDRIRRSMKLVFDEVLHNIISHAYQDRDRHSIEVNVELSEERLSVRVADDGTPFDPLSHPAPNVDVGIDERQMGGLGIHLVKNLMDEVHYARSDGKNVITLAKYLPERAKGGKESS